MSTENNTTKAKKATGWVTGLLTGWGVPGNIARIIAGAIIGAVIAAAALSESSCSAAYSQSAAGDISYTGSIVIPVEAEK